MTCVCYCDRIKSVAVFACAWLPCCSHPCSCNPPSASAHIPALATLPQPLPVAPCCPILSLTHTPYPLTLFLQILNFSIAYGKTAHGLSKDWGVSLEEAEATVERWYSDRPEVRDWQARTRSYAARYGWVNTMLGRRRGLAPGIHSSDRWLRSRAERAAINTPIQGSAADVATAAMLAIRADKWLAENGWELLLQVCMTA